MNQFDAEVAALAKQQKLYRIGTVAQILDTPEGTIRDWVNRGVIRACKIPGSSNVYIRKRVVDELVRQATPVRRAQ